MFGFTGGRTIVVSAVLFGFLCLLPRVSADEDVSRRIQDAPYVPPEDRLNVDSAIQKINAVRRESGLVALTIDPALMMAARNHALDLAQIDDVSHYGTDGTSPVDRVFNAGYSGIQTGENVSAGQRDIDEVIDGWLESASHRKTLLMREARHIGVALAYDPTTTYRTFWTLVIAEPF